MASYYLPPEEGEVFNTFHDMVHAAILSAGTGSASLKQIYAACMRFGRVKCRKTGGWRLVTERRNWKSHIRHTLYTTEKFLRCPHDSDSWTLAPAFSNTLPQTTRQAKDSDGHPALQPEGPVDAQPQLEVPPPLLSQLFPMPGSGSNRPPGYPHGDVAVAPVRGARPGRSAFDLARPTQRRRKRGVGDQVDSLASADEGDGEGEGEGEAAAVEEGYGEEDERDDADDLDQDDDDGDVDLGPNRGQGYLQAAQHQQQWRSQRHQHQLAGPCEDEDEDEDMDDADADPDITRGRWVQSRREGAGGSAPGSQKTAVAAAAPVFGDAVRQNSRALALLGVTAAAAAVAEAEASHGGGAGRAYSGDEATRRALEAAQEVLHNPTAAKFLLLLIQQQQHFLEGPLQAHLAQTQILEDLCLGPQLAPKRMPPLPPPLYAAGPAPAPHADRRHSLQRFLSASNRRCASIRRGPAGVVKEVAAAAEEEEDDEEQQQVPGELAGGVGGGTGYRARQQAVSLRSRSQVAYGAMRRSGSEELGAELLAAVAVAAGTDAAQGRYGGDGKRLRGGKPFAAAATAGMATEAVATGSVGQAGWRRSAGEGDVRQAWLARAPSGRNRISEFQDLDSYEVDEDEDGCCAYEWVAAGAQPTGWPSREPSSAGGADAEEALGGGGSGGGGSGLLGKRSALARASQSARYRREGEKQQGMGWGQGYGQTGQRLPPPAAAALRSRSSVSLPVPPGRRPGSPPQPPAREPSSPLLGRQGSSPLQGGGGCRGGQPAGGGASRLSAAAALRGGCPGLVDPGVDAEGTANVSGPAGRRTATDGGFPRRLMALMRTMAMQEEEAAGAGAGGRQSQGGGAGAGGAAGREDPERMGSLGKRPAADSNCSSSSLDEVLGEAGREHHHNQRPSGHAGGGGDDGGGGGGGGGGGIRGGSEAQAMQLQPQPQLQRRQSTLLRPQPRPGSSDEPMDEQQPAKRPCHLSGLQIADLQ